MNQFDKGSDETIDIDIAIRLHVNLFQKHKMPMANAFKKNFQQSLSFV